MMTVFMASLAGIPPLAGWFAKFVMFRAVFGTTTAATVALGVIAAVNSVVALFYYAAVARQMWFRPVPDGVEARPVSIPVALNAAIALCTVTVIVVGGSPQLFARVGELARF